MLNFLHRLFSTDGTLARWPGWGKANHRFTNRIGESFHQIVNSIQGCGIYMLDTGGRIKSWNHGAEQLMGWQTQDIIGKNYACFFPPEEVAAGKPRELLRLAMTQGRAEDEGWRLRKDGSRFWGNPIISPILDRRGILRGFSVISRDLTERRRNEERVHLVVEASPHAMLMVDSGGRITLVNSQCERLFGYPRCELIGQNVELLVPERFRAIHTGRREAFFHAPLARPMGARLDLFGRRKNGTEVPVEIGLNPVETDEGAFVLASIIDITERKSFEAQREAARIEAEILLKEVHHRVKNNMQVISSLLRLHAGKLKDPAQREVFSDCQNRIRSMSLIHERLYGSGQFARIEFAAYLAEMVRMILGSSAETAGRVRLDLHLDPLDISLDAAVPLSLISSELVLNALKHGFANARSGVLTIKLNAGTEYHELSVQDDGPGLAPDVAKDRTGGIGLDLVEGLIRQIHGKRVFDSEPGRTIITINWPAECTPMQDPII